MRRRDKAIHQQDEIEQILKTGRVCQLAFSADPVPYIVSLNYGYHAGALYFHAALEGRKIDLLKQLGRAAFTVFLDHGLINGEQACDWSIRYQSVVGSGHLVLFETAAEKRQGLDRLMAHYSDEEFSYPDKMVAATAVFKLVIDEISAKQSNMEG